MVFGRKMYRNASNFIEFHRFRRAPRGSEALRRGADSLGLRLELAQFQRGLQRLGIMEELELTEDGHWRLNMMSPNIGVVVLNSNDMFVCLYDYIYLEPV